MVVAAALGPGIAAAQEVPTDAPIPNGTVAGSTTSTPSPTPTPAAVRRAGGIDRNTTYVAAVSPTLKIVNYSYDRQNERMTILFESTVPDRILVRDALFAAEQEGFISMPEGKTANISPGRTRITVKARAYQGDSRVYIEARAGRGVLSTGLEGSNPFDRTSATMGWLGGAATALAMGIAAAYQQLRKEAKPITRYDDRR